VSRGSSSRGECQDHPEDVRKQLGLPINKEASFDNDSAQDKILQNADVSRNFGTPNSEGGGKAEKDVLPDLSCDDVTKTQSRVGKPRKTICPIYHMMMHTQPLARKDALPDSSYDDAYNTSEVGGKAEKDRSFLYDRHDNLISKADQSNILCSTPQGNKLPHVSSSIELDDEATDTA